MPISDLCVWHRGWWGNRAVCQLCAHCAHTGMFVRVEEGGDSGREKRMRAWPGAHISGAHPEHRGHVRYSSNVHCIFRDN
eukprot:5473379-Prymnesium_polylepis.1